MKRKAFRKKSKKKKKSSNAKRKHEHHYLFGDVPLIMRDGRWVADPNANLPVLNHPIYGEIPSVIQNGRWVIDPYFRPLVPKGAVAANIGRHSSTYYYETIPCYYYVDEKITCVDCNCTFIFSAQEKKYWYEDLQIPLGPKPTRCLSCRPIYRQGKALQKKLMVVTKTLNKQPNDPDALLAYAETMSHYYTHFARGDIERGIASARKVRKLASDKKVESLFWEGACLEAAGHSHKAKLAYEKFVVLADAHQHRDYFELATQRIKEIETAKQIIKESKLIM